MVLRVPGQGLLSRDLQGVPGDLFVILHIASDDRFERRGIDLWQYVTLSVEDCVLGTQVDIPTLQEPFPGRDHLTNLAYLLLNLCTSSLLSRFVR